MKKILFSICMAILMFASVGCRKDPQHGVSMATAYYTVQQSQWITGTQLDYFYASFEDVDITSDVIEKGCVVVYFVDSDNRDNPMPCEFYKQGTDANGNTVYYADKFSFDAEPGIVTFKFQASDFDNAVSLSGYGDITFKVCVLANN